MDISRRKVVKTIAQLGVASFVSENAPALVFDKKNITVVMVDTSLTIKSFDPATRTWASLMSSVSRGGRVVLGLVMGEADNRRGFRLVRDVTIPSFDIWKSREDNSESLKRAVDFLRSGMDEALKLSRSKKTELLRTLQEAERYFAGVAGAERECIFISDMLEDSSESVFEKEHLTSAYVQALIARKKMDRTLPDLRGVTFRAAG